jgi:putative N6-adenine-specific DNA methylase
VASRLFFASSPPGLEPVVAAELADLGLDCGVVPGGVTFTGDPACAALVPNMHTPTRLLMELTTKPCTSLSKLAEVTRAVRWNEVLVRGGKFDVSVTTQGSRLRNRTAIAKKVEHAIADKLRKEKPSRVPGVQRVSVKLNKDVVTLSIDCGGELLHKRGWRKNSVRAPLRENLAASILMAAGWQGDEPLYDPFCGSGTLLIEAARMVAGCGAGLHSRNYGFSSWPILGPAKKRTALRDWRSPCPIVGSDRDHDSVLAAAKNAQHAGVVMSFKTGDVSEVSPPTDHGLLVANPPWGMRLGQNVEGVYSALGRALDGPFRGWRAIFITPNTAHARRVSGAVELTTFSAGGIRVGLWAVEPRGK